MAQADYVVANGTGAAVRSDLNGQLAAIVSNNSGVTEPATMYAYQWWADTTTGLLKIRNAANNAWITLRELDGTLLMEDGTAAAPGLSFASDLDTGLFSAGANALGVATNGVERVEFGTTEVVFNDGGNDIDFRIEGDTEANLFFVDAGNDEVSFRDDVKIDSSGRLLVGTSTARSNFTNTTLSANLQVEGINFSGSSISSIRNSNDVFGPSLIVSKSRGTTVGSNTVVNSGDELGSIFFQGNDGSEFVLGARIDAVVDGTPGANDMPGRIVLSTTADGASSPTERMRITSTGAVQINTTSSDEAAHYLNVKAVNAAHFGDAYDSGVYGSVQIARGANQPDNKFHLAFVRDGQQVAGMGFLDNSSTFAIQNANDTTAAGVTLTGTATSWGTTSDERLKTITGSIENGLSLISNWRTVYFKYTSDGEAQTTRIGLIAQDVKATVPEAISVEEDELGTLQLRYTELIPVLVKALQESKERIEVLEAEVAALKGL